MPLNVRRFCNSALLIFTFSFVASAQTAAPTAETTGTAAPPTTLAKTTIVPQPSAPSAADVMRERVTKAKGFIAVKNYNAAIYELENIRRETADQTVHGVINVLLMNSFLEQGDYKRAQDFLGELGKAQKANKPNASANYFAAAGQIVRGARIQLERYKSLGLSVADRNLPKEAASDVQKMRETLEAVVEQSKAIGTTKKQTADAMALIEEATNARGSLAKDEYDAKRWKDEVADAREMLANSQSVILNAAGEPTTIEAPNAANVAANQNPNPANSTSPIAAPLAPNNQILTRAANNNTAAAPTQSPVAADNAQASNQIAEPIENKPSAAPALENTNAQRRDRLAEAVPTVSAPDRNSGLNGNVAQNTVAAPNAVAAPPAPKSDAPMQVGSLIEYATQKSTPVYPPTAKTLRTIGVVRVELTVDEKGQVAEVKKTSGPPLLQRAATDAVKKWKFRPFVRDGEPVRAVGFVNFSFTL